MNNEFLISRRVMDAFAHLELHDATRRKRALISKDSVAWRSTSSASVSDLAMTEPSGPATMLP